MIGKGGLSGAGYGDQRRDRGELMADMAAAWAHETAQPLAAATNYLSTARRLVDDNAEAVEALDKAVAQMMRAGRMVSRMRGFLAHRESEPTPQSLHDVIREASELAAPALKHASVALTLRLEAAEDLVVANRAEIEHALLCLIHPAIGEANGSSRRSATIATSVAARTIQTDIVVAEPAAGPLQYAGFFQAADAAGVLSLRAVSMIQSVIEAHRGRVWAPSVSAGRATVSFTLPLIEAARRDA